MAASWGWPVLCLLLTVALVARQRGRGVLGLLAVVFLVQALGPVVSYLRGDEIYQGIVVDHIDRATQGFALAIGGLLLADVVVRQRPALACLVDVRRPARWSLPVGALLVALSAYAALVVVRMGPGSLAAAKDSRIAAAGGGHYLFLTLALVASAAWPLIRPSRATRRLYAVFLVAYVSYCVCTAERDFVFVLLALTFLGQLAQPRLRLARLVAAGLVALFAISYLSAGRSSAPEAQSGALFQGSLLFVDTRVLDAVPASTPYAHGDTYLAALTSALTHGHVGGDVSPTRWLVESYAPSSTSGYGFSMSGEALLNFGILGVLPVFCVLGVAVNLIVNRIDASPTAAHLGYFLTMFVPYMFRSDSRGLLSGIVTCLVLHGGLALLARPPRPDPEVLPGATAGGHGGAAVPLR
jgi:hypothetical protein